MEFHTYLTKQNFVRSPVNPCISFKGGRFRLISPKNIQNVYNQISIILLWVDDILIALKTEAHLMQIKTRQNSRFKMTDLGKLSWFLGIQFQCEYNTIKMNPYIEKILSKFGMADCKPYSAPGEMDITKKSDEVDLIESTPYREIIGSI